MKKLMMVMAAAFSVVAFAQGPQSGPGRGPRRGPGGMGDMGGSGMHNPAVMAVMNPQVAEKLGLSAEVQAKLKKLDEDSRKTLKDLQQKLRPIIDRQAMLMQKTDVDEAAVMQAIDELFDLRKEMAKVQTRRMIAVKASLTPDQLAKALEEVKKVHEERRNRRMNGNGPRRGPGPRRNKDGEADGKAAPEAPAAPKTEK